MTDDKQKRDPLDRYYTPPNLAFAYLKWLKQYTQQDVEFFAEPCSGGGAFGQAAKTLWPNVVVEGCDIDPEAKPGYPFALVSVDDWKPTMHPDWIITNPHYKDVYTTVDTFVKLQQETGASILGLLLRLTTLEKILYAKTPPTMCIVSNQRPRWGGAGGSKLKHGDNCGPVLCVWEKDINAPTTIRTLPSWRQKGKAQ